MRQTTHSTMEQVEKLTEVITFLSTIYMERNDEREAGKHIQALQDVRTFLMREYNV